LELEQKIEYLNNLKTGDLVRQIKEQENALESLMNQEAIYKGNNVDYLAGYGEDSRAVKIVIAKLTLDPPIDPDTGKKATVARTEAWIASQRVHNDELVAEITKQNAITFECENFRIKVDMAKRRLSSLNGVLGLRTAQVEFLKE
jgi:hypothetical protein